MTSRPSAILKKDPAKSTSKESKPDRTMDVTDRRVSWGNYRVREYLNLKDDSSPCGPLIASEDLISAPLGSGNSGSPPSRTKPCLPIYMNIEDTPEVPACKFQNGGRPFLDEFFLDKTPTQCATTPPRRLSQTPTYTPHINPSAVPSFSPTNPLAQNSSVVKTPPPKGPKSCLRQSPGRLSFSSIKKNNEEVRNEGNMTSSPRGKETEGRIEANTEEMIIGTVENQRSVIEAKELEIDLQNSVKKLRKLREELLMKLKEKREAIETIGFLVQEKSAEYTRRESDNTQSKAQMQTTHVLTVAVDLLKSVEPWHLVSTISSAEGTVESYKHHCNFYNRGLYSHILLKVNKNQVMSGELLILSQFPDKDMEQMASMVLPVYLSSFKTSTLQQSLGAILDLAAVSVDRLLCFLLSYLRLRHDFNVISIKKAMDKVITKFSVGGNRCYLAKTTSMTLETRVDGTAGDIYAIARGLISNS